MQAKADANAEIHRRHIDALKRHQTALGQAALPGPDDMMGTAWPLYEQLIRLVAEDNAVADTLYHLGRALDTGAVSLDMYLKVRVGCGFSP
jgi:ESCRT-I complex subunit TSG101